MTENKNQPAFPIIVYPNPEQIHPGLTKREEFAKAAMQSIITNRGVGALGSQNRQNISYEAVEQADALLAALEKNK